MSEMRAADFSEKGNKSFEKRDFDQAILYFTEVIKLEPDNPFAYNKRGMSYINKKDYNLAIADFSKAIKLEPKKNGDFYMDRGCAYAINGNNALAIADLEMALNIDPQNNTYKETLDELKGKKRGLWQAIKTVYSTCWKGINNIFKDSSINAVIKMVFVLTPFVHLICLGLAVIICIVWAIKK